MIKLEEAAVTLDHAFPSRSEAVEIRGTKIQNFTNFPVEKLYNWLPERLGPSEVAFFPDCTPIVGGLPTGCVVKTSNPAWRKFAVSDVGCGMQLMRSGLHWNEFANENWDLLGLNLKKNKGGLGDLGGGNHFVDALVSDKDMRVWFLVHTGSRREGFTLRRLVNEPEKFDVEYERVTNWAKKNRERIASAVQSIFGTCDTVLDSVHNTVQREPNGFTTIRKGCVQVNAGEITVLPSHMTGGVALLRASEGISECHNSFPHGTGRAMSRTDARKIITTDDIEKAAQLVHIPPYMKREFLTIYAPKAYRDLDDCLTLMGDKAQVEERFTPIAFLGHL